MTTMQATTAKKKIASRKATVVMAAVGLLVCCSLSLRARVARSLPVLPRLSPSSAARAPADADGTRTEDKKRGGLALRHPRSRTDCCGDGDEEGARFMTAAASDLDEEAAAAAEQEGREAGEEIPSGGRQEKNIDYQGVSKPANKEIAGGAAAVETRLKVVPAPKIAAGAPARVSSDVAEPSDRCWIFMHLQKSGGSTVKEMLTASWDKRFFIYDNMRWKQGDEFSRTFGIKLARAVPWNVMAGGYTEALRRVPEVEDRCQFFTLFRHPIERIVSAYFYCKVLPLDKACASEVVQAKKVSLLDFAKHWGNFAVRQFALSFVPADDVQAYVRTPEARALYNVDLETTSGWFQLKAYLERPVEGAESGDTVLGQRETQEQIPGGRLYDMLQPAQDLIKNGYTVGILEEWNTTLALYDSALGMPGMDWRKGYAKDGKQNVNLAFEKLKAQTLERAWTDPELKQYLQLDLLLYEHALDVFHEQARSHGLLR